MAGATLKKSSMQLPVLRGVDAGLPAVGQMLMHVDVKERKIAPSVIVGQLQRLADRRRTHHCADAHIVDIVFVGDGIIACGQDHDAAVIEPARAAGNKPTLSAAKAPAG